MSPEMALSRLPAWLEQAWLARYLDRQLTGEESAWFEAYVLDKPELLEMIDADSRLTEALTADPSGLRGDVSADINAPRSESSDGTVRLTGQSGRRFGKRSSRKNLKWASMAAAIFLGVGFGWVGTRNFDSRQFKSPLITNPTRIVYDTMRGGAAPTLRVEHKESMSPYLLVEVAMPSSAENITVKIGSGPPQPLTTSPDGFVSFLVVRGEAHTATLSYGASGTNGTKDLLLGPWPEK